MTKQEYRPTRQQGSFARWDLPATAWSGAEHGEQTVRIFFEDGQWSGLTEIHQCVHRDLDQDEVASVCKEFQLVAPGGAPHPVGTNSDPHS